MITIGTAMMLRDLGVLFQRQTTTEYQDQARTFLSRTLHPRFVQPCPSLTYRPMLELIAVLHRLEFSVVMCTDSSRDFIRVIAGSAYGLGREHIIGSEGNIESIQGRLVRTATPGHWTTGRATQCTCRTAPVLNRCSLQATQQVTSRCSRQHSSTSLCTTTTASGSTRIRTTRFSTRRRTTVGQF